MYANRIYLFGTFSTVWATFEIVEWGTLEFMESGQLEPLRLTRVGFNLGIILTNIIAMVAYYLDLRRVCASSIFSNIVMNFMNVNVVLCEGVGCGRKSAQSMLLTNFGDVERILPILVFTMGFFYYAVIFSKLVWTVNYTLGWNVFPRLSKLIAAKRHRLRRLLYLLLITDAPCVVQAIIHTLSRMGHTRRVDKMKPQDIGVCVMSTIELVSVAVKFTFGMILYRGLRTGNPVLINRYMFLNVFLGMFFLPSFIASRYQNPPEFWILLLTFDVTMVTYAIQAAAGYAYTYVLKHGWGMKYYDSNTPCKPEQPYLKNLAMEDIEDIGRTPVGFGHTCVVYKCNLKTRQKSFCGNKIETTEGALKVYKQVDSEALCRELFNLSRIMLTKCPNVVTFLGVCIRDLDNVGDSGIGTLLSPVNVILGYCPNGSIKEFLQAHCVQLTREQGLGYNLTEQLHGWAVGVGNGMDYLAKHSLIHGDLAARNILLTENLTPKIADFGLSYKIYGSKLYEHIGCNEKFAWRWMAPEVLSTLKVHLEYSDVWSFGMLLWELYTLGMDPWGDCVWSSNFIDQLEAGVRPDFPRFATQRIYNECMRPCWEFEPMERTSFAKLLESLSMV